MYLVGELPGWGQDEGEEALRTLQEGLEKMTFNI